MAAYAVTDLSTTSNESIEAATALLEILLETIDNAKTLRYVDIIELLDQRRYIGIVIHDA